MVIDAIAVSMLPDDTDSSDSSDEMWMRNHPTPRRSSIAFHPYATTTMATPRRRNDLRIFHSMSFDVCRIRLRIHLAYRRMHSPHRPHRVSPMQPADRPLTRTKTMNAFAQISRKKMLIHANSCD
ncbi:hypothetical protein [Lysobacter capsici]|uniref:hypothetical protein n=1 Tax=Lysobacter capsici TaxID=435897 RepID=UPI0012904428|nr:hypothetical protein [Lysobacter capsici]